MERYLDHLSLDAIDPEELSRLSSLKLAYLGDAIYEVYIRRYCLATDRRRIHDINKAAVKFVRASAQAHAAIGLKPILMEEEWDVIKKGRNQKSATVPKNASIAEYRYATGFEALIGYLWLKGDRTRLEEILRLAIGMIEERTPE